MSTDGNWINGTPQIATEDHLRFPWSGRRDGYWFRCGFCGHRFKVGDVWRFFYGNGFAGGRNVFVCRDCDDTDETLKLRWLALCAEWDAMRQGRFWHFAAESKGTR